MDGKPWMVGKFTFSLRVSLWLEHLGLHAGEVSQIIFIGFCLIEVLPSFHTSVAFKAKTLTLPDLQLQISQICDPVANKTYTDLWMEIAKVSNNAFIFHK